jgi:hypothetical protein
MRLICFGCGKPVSSPVPDETIVRAVLYCPECIPRAIREDAPSILNGPELQEQQEP